MGRPRTVRESLPTLRKIVHHFWPYVRQEYRLIILSLLALFAGIAFRLVDPWPLKFVFDRFLHTSHHHHTSFHFINSLDSQRLLIYAAIAVVVLTVLRALSDYFNTVGFAMIGNRVLLKVRNALYRHLQNLPLSFHTKARGGDLTVRVTSDVNMLKDVLVTAVLPLIANVLIMIAMVILMFFLDWKLTLLALSPVPLMWLWTIRLSKRIHDAARNQRQREGALAATAAESITAIQIVQALSLQTMFSNFFQAHSQKSQREDVRGARLSASLERAVDIHIAVGASLVLLYGGFLVLRGSLTPGDLLVFLTYLKRAFNPLQDFAKYTGRMAKATAAGERVVDLLDQPAVITDRPDAIVAPAFRGVVEFDDVCFGYEPERTVLERINFNVQPGQHIALVGPSGIGKSTLVSLILRLYDPITGAVRIDGRDIRDYRLDSLRSQISVVLQDSILFAASVRDNISYGSPFATNEEIEAAARLSNAHSFILNLPNGYNTILGERGVTLSHGQRQRIAIARAAVRKSAILILDEPTTGLDRENERAVVEALERLAEGCTTFLITHNLPFAARSDLIFYLHGCRLVEQGSHQELMNARGHYSTLFALRSQTPMDLSDAHTN